MEPCVCHCPLALLGCDINLPRHNPYRSVCVLSPPLLSSPFPLTQQPGVQALVSTLVCLVAVLAHVTFRPLHNAASQHMQTGLLLCLAVVALASVPLAEREEAALAVSSTRVTSTNVADALTVTFGTVVPVVLLALAYAVPAALLKWGPSSMRGAGAVGAT